MTLIVVLLFPVSAPMLANYDASVERASQSPHLVVVIIVSLVVLP
jgi:hypothetical protein